MRHLTMLGLFCLGLWSFSDDTVATPDQKPVQKDTSVDRPVTQPEAGIDQKVIDQKVQKETSGFAKGGSRTTSR